MAFHPIDRDIDYLLPPSVQEWLPESHLARYVVDVVEGQDLSALERAYAGRGSDAYPPAMLLSMLIYGYATGTFSSRKIERASYDSLAFRYIACNRHPDHDTLATFHPGHLPQALWQGVQRRVCSSTASGPGESTLQVWHRQSGWRQDSRQCQPTPCPVPWISREDRSPAQGGSPGDAEPGRRGRPVLRSRWGQPAR